MIRIELLPAAFGDCILIEYGDANAPHRILIDAGLAKTFDELRPRLEAIGNGKPVDLELLVVTHIDRDHICGILPLLKHKPALITPKDVWFNGRQHLENDALGAKDGEALGKLLVAQKLPWNAAFGDKAKKAVVVQDQGALPETRLAGGAVITLLSPYPKQLEALAKEWDDTLGNWDDEPAAVDVGHPAVVDDILGKRPALKTISVADIDTFVDERFSEDKTKPNGSSIAFLFSFEGKTILFGADAHPSALLKSLERLSPGKKVTLDAFKLSHHGSMNNLSPDLLEKVDCPRFLFSTNGDSFGHPHPETVARLAKAPPRGKTLCFNYSTPYTTVWDDAATRRKFHYEVSYPPAGKNFVLEL